MNNKTQIYNDTSEYISPPEYRSVQFPLWIENEIRCLILCCDVYHQHILSQVYLTHKSETSECMLMK